MSDLKKKGSWLSALNPFVLLNKDQEQEPAPIPRKTDPHAVHGNEDVSNFEVDENHSKLDILYLFLDFKIEQVGHLINDPSLSIKTTIKLHEEIVNSLKLALKDDDWQSVCRFHYITYARNKKEHDLGNTKFSPLPEYLRTILLALDDMKGKTPPLTAADLRPGFVTRELQKYLGKYHPKVAPKLVPHFSS